MIRAKISELISLSFRLTTEAEAFILGYIATDSRGLIVTMVAAIAKLCMDSNPIKDNPQKTNTLHPFIIMNNAT
jgi:hypothetical protein